NGQLMKIYRFLHEGRSAVGVADGEHLFRHDGTDAIHLGARIESIDEPPHLIASVQLLPPVTPSKIVAVGRNYAAHARELGFDTFAPLGPCIETAVDPNDLAITTRVNGATKQSGRTSMMVFDCAFLVAFISSVMTLLPGDVVLTGTPAGVGPLGAGDVVEVEI